MDFSKVSIGTNSANVNAYLEKIKAEVINAAVRALDTEQDALFETFRQNWKGVAEKTFEDNMKLATEDVKKALQKHYSALEAKVVAINSSWVKQDEELVEYQGGWGGIFK